MAYLFYNTKKYKDFSLEVDIKSPTDKRSSVETILDRISDGDSVLKEKLNGEFKELTNIGNNYQIRHFETGKLPINDIRIKEYLYTRCLSLINLSIGFIEEKC